MAASEIASPFIAVFGRPADVIATAPGRVNLIGEHTDYNEGLALPMAIDRRVQIALALRDDDRIVARSERFAETREFAIGPSGPTSRDVRVARPSGLWFDYVAAVVRALRDAGIAVPACDLLITAGVPEGAGLSSSASLEVALARALFEAANATWDPEGAARIAQRAENEYVGVRCGIMDQLASACARAGHAMLMDFRDVTIEHSALPDAVSVVVMDTGARRSLSASEYNERREACERAVAAIRAEHPEVRALRDADESLLEAAAPRLDPVALDCARHVIAENERPPKMRDALAAKDFGSAGALMDESHRSLRDLYRVSSAQLDIACEVARGHPACFGARMTGAGFGGCAIALVRADAVAEFVGAALSRYESATYKRGEFYAVSADDGARLERARFQ